MRNLGIAIYHIGPYHRARLTAASRGGRVVALELYGSDRSSGWDRVDRIPGCDCLTLFPDRGANRGRAAERRIDWALSAARVDVVAIPGWSDRAAVAVLNWCLRNGAPAVILSDSTRCDGPRSWWKELIKRRIVANFAAGLVAGRRQREYLMDLGMEASRLHTGYDVVDNDHFAAGADAVRCESATWRQRLGLPERYFLAASRLVAEKNLPRLVHAYHRYRRSVGDDAWSLVIVGDGPERARLVRLIDELGIASAVTLRGFCQYPDMPHFFGLAEAFILASTSESWGLVVNEAMAAGLPVLVSSRCGCAPDLVAEAHNGWTFEPFDIDEMAAVMCRVAATDCDRGAMGRVSREIVGHWTPLRFADSLWQAADLAMKAPCGRPRLTDQALLRLLSRTRLGEGGAEVRPDR